MAVKQDLFQPHFRQHSSSWLEGCWRAAAATLVQPSVEGGHHPVCPSRNMHGYVVFTALTCSQEECAEARYSTAQDMTDSGSHLLGRQDPPVCLCWQEVAVLPAVRIARHVALLFVCSGSITVANQHGVHTLCSIVSEACTDHCSCHSKEGCMGTSVNCNSSFKGRLPSQWDIVQLEGPYIASLCCCQRWHSELQHEAPCSKIHRCLNFPRCQPFQW